VASARRVGCSDGALTHKIVAAGATFLAVIELRIAPEMITTRTTFSALRP
jgi:hypothetical protein